MKEVGESALPPQILAGPVSAATPAYYILTTDEADVIRQGYNAQGEKQGEAVTLPRSAESRKKATSYVVPRLSLNTLSREGEDVLLSDGGLARTSVTTVSHVWLQATTSRLVLETFAPDGNEDAVTTTELIAVPEDYVVHGVMPLDHLHHEVEGNFVVVVVDPPKAAQTTGFGIFQTQAAPEDMELEAVLYIKNGGSHTAKPLLVCQGALCVHDNPEFVGSGVVPLGNGGFLITWADKGQATNQVVAKRYNAEGEVQGNVFPAFDGEGLLGIVGWGPDGGYATAARCGPQLTCVQLYDALNKKDGGVLQLQSGLDRQVNVESGLPVETSDGRIAQIWLRNSDEGVAQAAHFMTYSSVTGAIVDQVTVAAPTDPSVEVPASDGLSQVSLVALPNEAMAMLWERGDAVIHTQLVLKEFTELGVPAPEASNPDPAPEPEVEEPEVEEPQVEEPQVEEPQVEEPVAEVPETVPTKNPETDEPAPVDEPESIDAASRDEVEILPGGDQEAANDAAHNSDNLRGSALEPEENLSEKMGTEKYKYVAAAAIGATLLAGLAIVAVGAAKRKQAAERKKAILADEIGY
ncbi:unnamed protein product [Chrysoparadoxa australica]